MERFSLDNISKFEFQKAINKEFSLFKCWVAGVGKNRNKSFISKEEMDNALPTLAYSPVVGHLIKGDDGNYRLGSHDMTFDPDTWELVNLTVPVGVVMADSFNYETVNEYGLDVDYVTANVILWTGRYPELFDCKYSDEIFCAESMEILVNECRPYEEDSNYMELLDFSFSALCLLGKSDNPEFDNKPCFISSRLEPINFSADDFVAKFNELKEAVKDCFESTKEGETMDNNTIENTELSTEETKIEDVVSDDVPSGEDTEEKTASETTETEETPVDYEAKFNEAVIEIENLNAKIAEFSAQITELNNNVEALTPYKLIVEKAEREKAENEIFAKYDARIGDMPEYKALKEKSNDYELEQLDKECVMLVGMFAMRECPVEKTEEKENVNLRFSMETAPKKVSPYGDWFERYANNDED